jgi:hypothetical protein
LEHFVLEGRFGHRICHFQGSFPNWFSYFNNASAGCRLPARP